MARQGILGRALRTRVSRAVALAGACVLAAQAAQLPILAGADIAGCCCPHSQAGEKCPCPACVHRRAEKEGQRVFETCAPDAASVAIPSPAPAVPALASLPGPRPGPAAIIAFNLSPPPGPAPEVPTPPPLG